MQYPLPDLGWSSHFMMQLSIEELETLTPARIIAVHRNGFDALSLSGPQTLIVKLGNGTTITVGDWVLADQTGMIHKRLDTPGMRALRLADAGDGIEAVFADIAALAEQCRFRDCAHEREPGCAIQAEIAAGRLDPDRLRRWQKLEREDQRNSETAKQRNSETAKHWPNPVAATRHWANSISARRPMRRGAKTASTMCDTIGLLPMAPHIIMLEMFMNCERPHDHRHRQNPR